MIGRYRITDQLLDEFRRRLVTEEKSELTIAQYMRDVRDFCGFLQKGEPVDKPVGGSGVHEGLPAQPAPPVREGILRGG